MKEGGKKMRRMHVSKSCSHHRSSFSNSFYTEEVRSMCVCHEIRCLCVTVVPTCLVMLAGIRVCRDASTTDYKTKSSKVTIGTCRDTWLQAPPPHLCSPSLLQEGEPVFDFLHSLFHSLLHYIAMTIHLL